MDKQEKPTWLGLRQRIAELEREVAEAKAENERFKQMLADLRGVLATWGKEAE